MKNFDNVFFQNIEKKEENKNIPSRKIIFYNFGDDNEEIENPEELITENERETLEKTVNTDFIKEKAEFWKKYLLEKIDKNNVVLLGEAHSSILKEKFALMEILEEAKRAGITHIGLEVDEYWQKNFDMYEKEGKFEETENEDDYKELNNWLTLGEKYNRTRDKQYLEDFLKAKENLRDNFLVRNDYILEYPVIKKARELGISIKCLDSDDSSPEAQEKFEEASEKGNMDEYYSNWEFKRDNTMYKNVQEIVENNGKILVMVGSAHIQKDGFRHKNLGDLLSEDVNIKSFSVHIDRDINSDFSETEFIEVKDNPNFKNINFNSVMYTALDKETIYDIGFDLEDSILIDDKNFSDFSYDGYIKI